MTVSNKRNSFDPFELQTLCSFHQVSYKDKFFVLGTISHCQLLEISLRGFEKLPPKIGPKSCLKHFTGNVCKSLSLSPTSLFGRFSRNDYHLLTTNTQLFSQSSPSHSFGRTFETLSTIYSLWNH